MLKEGQKAPNFTVTDVNGNSVSLSDYEGEKVMICFMRYAGCPFCNLSLLKINEQAEKWMEKGLHILVFFQSDAQSIKDKPTDINPPFPLIPDPKKEVYDKYKVYSSWKKALKTGLKSPKYIAEFVKYGIPQGKINKGNDLLLVPAFFLIAPSGLIIHSQYFAADFGEHIPFIQIEDFLTFD